MGRSPLVVHVVNRLLCGGEPNAKGAYDNVPQILNVQREDAVPRLLFVCIETRHCTGLFSGGHLRHSMHTAGYE